MADIFADGLRQELKVLSEDPAPLGGLLAVGGAHDKATRIVDAIAERVMVGPLADPAWASMGPPKVAAARRVAFTRQVLAPLRAAAWVPELQYYNRRLELALSSGCSIPTLADDSS